MVFGSHMIFEPPLFNFISTHLYSYISLLLLDQTGEHSFFCAVEATLKD